MKRVDFKKVKRILVIKLRHHGDVLLSTPIYKNLRRHAPKARIDLYLYQETTPMLEGDPSIGLIHSYDKGWKKRGFWYRVYKELSLLLRLRRERYDLVINLTEGDRGAIVALLSGAPYRIGVDPQGTGMAFKAKCYTGLIYAPPGFRHTVEKHIDALRAMGIFPKLNERELSFHIPEVAKERMMERTGANPYIHVHATSRWEYKCVPAEHVATVIDRLIEEGHRVVLTSSPDPNEREYNQEVIRQLKQTEGVVDLSGQTNLKELGALVKGAELLICVDSVPLHLASVFKTPVVAIFGPSSHLNWGPWQHPQARVVREPYPCQPCYLPGCSRTWKSDCLETLSPEKTLCAAFELLESQVVASDTN